MKASHLRNPTIPDTAAPVWWSASHMLLLLFCLGGGQAMASEPKDRVICTDEPESTWMSEAESRKRFHAEAYMLLTFKKSSEKCHEFYAVEHDGTAIEAYVHPVTGAIVRMTRIPPPGKLQAEMLAAQPAPVVQRPTESTGKTP